MSDRKEGFRGKSIEEVQLKLFLRDLARCKGRWHYATSGLNAASGTIVLFQFKARVIASAVLLRDERYERPRDGCAGALHFDIATIRVFEPVDAEGMRAVWPGFRGFGHVKQVLNPARFKGFEKRMKGVRRAGEGASR